MTRRYASTGRFRPAPPLADVPLFDVAFAHPAKSDRVSRGNVTRRRLQRARVLAVAAALRAEARGAMVAF